VDRRWRVGCPTLDGEGEAHAVQGRRNLRARVDDMRHIAAKDRTFKTVRPNQGTARGLFRSGRRPSL